MLLTLLLGCWSYKILLVHVVTFLCYVELTQYLLDAAETFPGGALGSDTCLAKDNVSSVSPCSWCAYLATEVRIGKQLDSVLPTFANY